MEPNRFRFRAWVPEHKIDGLVMPAHMTYKPVAGASITRTKKHYHQRTLDTTSTAKVYVNDIFSKQAGDYIWMQSTGQEDWQGVEIFEGDIIKRTMHHPEYGEYRNYGEWIDVVEYHTDGACFYYKNNGPMYNHMTGWMDLEVIGNIYENPDLLPKP